MMYEYAIKKDHNKFAKEMHKLKYHGNTRCNKAIIMCVNPCIGCKLAVSMRCPSSMTCGSIINQYGGCGTKSQRSVDLPKLDVVA